MRSEIQATSMVISSTYSLLLNYTPLMARKSHLAMRFEALIAPGSPCSKCSGVERCDLGSEGGLDGDLFAIRNKR